MVCFWCDIDMIFGNLIDYVKKQSSEFECMSFAAEPYPLPYGPCTLIKNNVKMNMLFQKSKDIDKLLTTQRHFHFDEDLYNNRAIFKTGYLPNINSRKFTGSQ